MGRLRALALGGWMAAGLVWALAGQVRPALFLGNEALPPILFLQDGLPTGLVVDLARAAARRMHRPVEIRLLNWALAQQQVQQGRAEALLQVNPSPERRDVYDFSEPLLDSEFVIFTTPGHLGVASLQGLAGLRVGAEPMGLPALLLKTVPAAVPVPIPDILRGFRMLQGGDLDAVVADRWVGGYLLAQHQLQGIEVAGPPVSRSQSAIAVRKGDAALLQDLNQALAGLRRDGSYERILAAWRPKQVVFRTREQLHRQAWLVAAVSLALVLALAGLGALGVEIRRRRRAEAALRESEQRFRLALAQAPVSVAVQDLQLKYVWAYNQRTARPEEILGHSDREIFTPAEADRLEALKRRVLEEDVELHEEMWLDRPAGRIFLDVYLEPLHDRAGRITGIGLATLDLTALKLAEDALKQAEAELREIDRRRMDFLAVLSHELRNPIAPIRYSLTILDQAAPDSDPARLAREVIDRQARHLSRLIEDLLDVTRITRDKLRLQREPLDLGEQVARTVADHRALFEERGVALETALAPAVRVDGDRIRLAQVLDNLLQNAVKFTPAGGRVLVALQVEAGAALLTVADDGCGIEPGQAARLFEAFAQAERTLDRSPGGLGLGLALVKGLAELHGGSAWCESEGPGRGSRFRVRLPLAAGADANPARSLEEPGRVR